MFLLRWLPRHALYSIECIERLIPDTFRRPEHRRWLGRQAGADRIGQDWTGLDRIGQDWTGLDRIGQTGRIGPVFSPAHMKILPKYEREKFFCDIYNIQIYSVIINQLITFLNDFSNCKWIVQNLTIMLLNLKIVEKNWPLFDQNLPILKHFWSKLSVFELFWLNFDPLSRLNSVILI